MEEALENLYNSFQADLGKLVGQSIDVYRPPYGTTVDQTPALIASGIKFKVEKGRPNLAQPGLYNIEYYSVFGDYTQILAGDVLVPTDPNSNTPPVVFLSKSPGEESKAFRAKRFCKLITNFSPETGLPNVIYSNVRFDFLPTGFPSNQFADLVLGRGITPTMSVIMFSLPNLQQINVTTHDIIGMKLVHTGGAQEVTYTIKLAEEVEPMMHLTLQQE